MKSILLVIKNKNGVSNGLMFCCFSISSDGLLRRGQRDDVPLRRGGHNMDDVPLRRGGHNMDDVPLRRGGHNMDDVPLRRGRVRDGIRTPVLVGFQLWDLRQTAMLLLQWPRC